MLLRVPYLGLPKELGAYSMLGFGDIILPGRNKPPITCEISTVTVWTTAFCFSVKTPVVRYMQKKQAVTITPVPPPVINPFLQGSLCRTSGRSTSTSAATGEEEGAVHPAVAPRPGDRDPERAAAVPP